jgi:hypothetical protein
MEAFPLASLPEQCLMMKVRAINPLQCPVMTFASMIWGLRNLSFGTRSQPAIGVFVRLP